MRTSASAAASACIRSAAVGVHALVPNAALNFSEPNADAAIARTLPSSSSTAEDGWTGKPGMFTHCRPRITPYFHSPDTWPDASIRTMSSSETCGSTTPENHTPRSSTPSRTAAHAFPTLS